jgi:hypothetical protein
MEKNAIAYFQYAPSGCSWYRIEHPMNALAKAGVTVHNLPIGEDIDDSIIDSLKSVILYGAVPFDNEAPLKFFKEKGIKIVYDMDDALELVDINNPFYYTVKKDVGSVNLALEYADHITVATPELERFVRAFYGFKGHITVIPNCYDISEWGHNRVPHEEIRVGFAGASPHVPDLIEIIPAIKNLQEKHNIKFYIMGFGQDNYEDWAKAYRFTSHKEAHKELQTLGELLKTIKFEWIPFVNYTEYPRVLTNLSLDIGLCPLKSTPFNDCRSASKAMEYNLSGAIVLASDVIPYRQDPTSILIRSAEEWETAIEKMIHKIKNNQVTNYGVLQWLKNNREISTQVDLLKSVYLV